MEKAKIFDAPLFTYRGLMLDTSNHFIHVETIKRTIKAMGAVKMNVLHWRLTDTFSFPFYFENNKHALYGAYSSKEIYTNTDIRGIVEYALLCGVRVSIEFDNPGHIYRGWNWGPREGYGDLYTYLSHKTNDISFHGTANSCHLLNPSNKRSYELIKDILVEINKLTGQSDIIHLGGYNTNISCWKNSDDVRNMEPYKNKGLMGVFKYHQNLIQSIVTEIHKDNMPNMTLWSDYFKFYNDPTKILNSKFYIAEFNGLALEEEEKFLINKGYRVILSHQDKWFLNYIPLWTDVYSHRPWEYFLWSEKEQILGGEACLWTEFVDDTTLDGRLWPATAALAEVLWSEPPVVSLPEATLRLQIFRERLNERGIKSNPIVPQWCVQNPGDCL